MTNPPPDPVPAAAREIALRICDVLMLSRLEVDDVAGAIAPLVRGLSEIESRRAERIGWPDDFDEYGDPSEAMSHGYDIGSVAALNECADIAARALREAREGEK